MLVRQKRLADAEIHINTFLAFELTKRERANGLLLKSQIFTDERNGTRPNRCSEAWSAGKLKRANASRRSRARARKLCQSGREDRPGARGAVVVSPSMPGRPVPCLGSA